ncbi:MAG: type III secretion protein N (ATPase) [Psychrobacter glaciei]|jgi:type III secretion protein N (ATPase)
MTELNYQDELDLLLRFSDRIKPIIRESKLVRVYGRVTEVVGTIIKAVVPGVQVGELCYLQTPGQKKPLLAEVVGLSKSIALLTPIGDMYGVSTSTEVIPTGAEHEVGVGPELLGHVLNGLGEPLNGKSVVTTEKRKVVNSAPDPMTRRLIKRPLSMGVKAIDALLTCGEGQRLGIFAAAGGGKSTLMSMLVKGADADVIVIALIGERGREVREFIEHDLGSEGLKRSVVVVATSDRPAMERVKAAQVATTIAEYFRDQGKRVLLLMDSVTRFARAQREIGLAAGEPPTRRGFPPSVFASLPKLMERVGQNDKGSITAFYTVLVEGDDMTEPVADETRSILDGHIVLSRKLAIENHYPAIDVLASVSRVMDSLVSQQHKLWADKLRGLLAKYEEIDLLVKIGEYQVGSDSLADLALEKNVLIKNFLKQAKTEKVEFDDVLQDMARVLS